ncbi:MAG: hypothetical protein CBD16_09575 [Betaproteobacteria bacterium TMED156]|nr:MAG: hypothetical protein CBD16_09575 [Betaproteobacteria bacterium TMED156]
MNNKNKDYDNSDSSKSTWERDIIGELLKNYLAEKKRARFWSFFKWSFLFLLIFLGIMGFGSISKMTNVNSGFDSHTALINLAGTIQVDGDVDAQILNESIRNAFNSPKSVGVILRINSPGGSPVQSAIIYDEILRLRKINPDKPIIAVVEDIAASGAYYIASAAEKIYVNKSSIVGSIGVLINGFGFPDLMQEIGIERRLMTAGKNKAMLDPFSEINPNHKDKTQKMLDEIHKNFIDAVTSERGNRLSNDPIVFSGMVFTGLKSIELGLSDELGSVGSVARTVFKVENVVDYTIPSSFLEKLGDELKSSFGSEILLNLLNSEGNIPIR